MIEENSIINVILRDKSTKCIADNDLTLDHFLQYPEEIKFVLEHQSKYKVVPDVITFLSYFEEWNWYEVNESPSYLADILKENLAFRTVLPLLRELETKIQAGGSAYEAIDFLKNNISALMKLSDNIKRGTNVVTSTESRKLLYKKNSEMGGVSGVTTGLRELDLILNGWMEEDLVLIIGRTNEGKTWVLLYFLVAAWLAGYDVLLYSGEMSTDSIGYRHDTLSGHFNHTSLLHGNGDLGDGVKVKTYKDYVKYLDDISTNETKFLVVTQEDLGEQKLTVPMLHDLIEYHNPALIGCDQLSLMEDARAKNGDNGKTKYGNIAEDLIRCSKKFRKPIILPVQANRQSVNKRKNGEEELIEELICPGTEDIYDSDLVGQHATRAIGIRSRNGIMKIRISKNRYGIKDVELMLVWDMTYGVVRPFLQQEQTGDMEEPIHTTVLAGDDLF